MDNETTCNGGGKITSEICMVQVMMYVEYVKSEVEMEEVEGE